MGEDLLEVVKRAALSAVESSFPCELRFGVVVGVQPLRIGVEQRLVLSEAQLILPRRFSDHSVRISGGNVRDFYFSGEAPDAAAEPVSPPHVHAVADMEITVHGALRVGDEVILIRQQGGQKYLIFDLLGKEGGSS